MAVAYERRDIDLGRLFRIGFVLASIVAMSFVLMWWLFGYLVEHEVKTSSRQHPLADKLRRIEPPPPLLQTTPHDDLAALRRYENGLLATYGWIDKDRGVVRIPIEKAMDLLAERGVLARSAPGGEP